VIESHAEVLVSTHDLSHEEWLNERKKGIGGSDASVVMGLSKWKSPIQLYMEKIGELPKEDSQSEAAYFGNILEDVVAKEFMRRTGKKVRHRHAILKHPDYPWMVANVDRLIVGERVGLECKTTSAYLKDKWTDEEVPAEYLIQCQHYMAVTGYDAWWIAVLIGGNQFLYKKIERDDELIRMIIDKEKDFWVNHVEKKHPPDVDGSEASSQLLKSLYPESDPENDIDLPDQATLLLEGLENVNHEMKTLTTYKNNYENQLKNMLGESEKGYASNYIVTWKSQERRTVDTKRLKQERPDIYQSFLKTSSSRTLRYKEVN